MRQLLTTVATLAVGAAVAMPAGAQSAAHPAAHSTARPAARSAAAAPARVVTITARDYAFQAPDTLVAGRTELRLANLGPELHHAQLIRLGEGKTPADFFNAFKALKPGDAPPAWVREVGGPNAPAPGQTSVVVVDLAPGTYMMVCFIPSPDGTPHVMKGMTRAFTVVPAHVATPVRNAAGAGPRSTLPAPDVTMTLSDYDFVLSAPLTPGKHVMRVTNGAAQAHEVFVARLAPGKTVHDALAWIEKMQGPPPMLPFGGTVGMATGESNDVALDLTPGEYALLCFLPDAKDGKPHIMHGMAKQVSVK